MSAKAQGHRWPLGIPGTVSDVTAAREEARFGWLCVLADIEPAILRELEAASDEPARAAWAARWRLTEPWMTAHVQATLIEWIAYPTVRGRTWADRDDTSGGWTSDGTVVRGTRWYKDAAAFDWLARVHLGATYADLARVAGRSVQTIRGAVRALAAFIEMPVSARGQGRPRRS